MDVYIYDWKQLYLPYPVFVRVHSSQVSNTAYICTDSIETLQCRAISDDEEGILYNGGKVSTSKLVKVRITEDLHRDIPIYTKTPYKVVNVGYGMYTGHEKTCEDTHDNSIWTRPSSCVRDISIVVYDYSYRFYVRRSEFRRIHNNDLSLAGVLSQLPSSRGLMYGADYWIDEVRGSLLRNSNSNVDDVFDSVHIWCDDTMRDISRDLQRWSRWKLNIYEDDISSTVCFLNNSNIPSCGWITVRTPLSSHASYSRSVYMGENVVTTCLELHASYTDVQSSNSSKQMNPLVLSMDIEAYTPRSNSFPKSYINTDEIRMIGTTLKWHMSSVVPRCIAFTVNTIGQLEEDIIHIPLQLGGTYVLRYSTTSFVAEDGIPITLVLLHTEMDMIIAYMHYVACMKPHVIVGWNHIGYDYSYISDRYYVHLDKRVNYSRSHINTMSFDVVKWSSSAYRYNNFTIIDADGVIDIDLMQYLTKYDNYKQYSLKYVSSIELSNSKLDLDYHEMFKLFTTGSYDDIKVIAEYCIRDTTAPLAILEKKMVWLTTIEASRVLRCLPRDICTHGSGSKIIAQIHYECKTIPQDLTRSCYIMNPEPNKEGMYSEYDGAFVLSPITGIHNNAVSLDFASLYPSIIIHDNICYTTFVPHPYCHNVSPGDSNYTIIYVPFSQSIPYGLRLYAMSGSMLIAERRYIPAFCTTHIEKDNKILLRFVFNKTKVGIIPELLKRLLRERSRCKKIMKTCPDEDRNVWDRRQYSYKIAANSVYGILGSKNAMLMFIIGASCVTSRGKQHLLDAKEVIEKYNGTVIYGDTDSCFLTISGVTSYNDYKDRCDVICREISKINDGVVTMQFENMFTRFMSLGKKRYACIKHNGSSYYRGVASVRRTKSSYLVDMYDELLKIALDPMQSLQLELYTKEVIFDVLGGNVPLDDLACLVRWNGHNATSHVHLLEKHMRLIGRNVESGSYMCYLPIHGPWTNSTKVGERLRDRDWCKMYSISIDYLFYIQRELMEEFDKILRVSGYPSIVSGIVSFVRYCIGARVIPPDIDDRVTSYIKHVLSLTPEDLESQATYDLQHSLVNV
jgi:DNA polymerase elongation subunit (family B)